MARLSNVIEEYIRTLLAEKDGNVEIKRNVLAQHFGCAPSQINYVLTTRFTPVQGFYVESRRGGGGYIRIVQVEIEDNRKYADLLQEEIGDSLTRINGDRILDALAEGGFLDEREKRLLKIALSDRALAAAGDVRNRLRAEILQNVLLGIFS
ncbi:Transcriptional regulator CtsR [Aedoeadaptatus ivorii]|uniref:Transcriptional regulator CtsR n=1 Tax=Aedoeadaptatus ivorii TaxID=54006 RepID=A0A448V0F2_9FIRM|nr:CtsR family transcriptional regulator [Peptoniphilus ivorii]MDQ0508057.1 transcriptional regulator CtsR [Peptoniphilus ivorii]VEJ34973.1 Transcriptional regulator CtsR [Peptoniphilus ivorii]